MRDWLGNGGVKVERAKEHIGEIEAQLKAFLAGWPYYISQEIDEQKRRLVRRVRVLREPPLRLGAIAGDVLHNLRSSLDILWRQVWYPEGGGETDHSIEFPIYELEDGLKLRFPRDRLPKNRRRKAAVELILDRIKPYKASNEPLWMLHETNGADKHRLLIPAYASVESSFITSMVMTPTGGGLERFPSLAHWAGKPFPVQQSARIYPVIDGAVVYDADVEDPAVLMPGEVNLEIVFGEGVEIRGRPIVPTLYEIMGAVEATVQEYLNAGLVK